MMRINMKISLKAYICAFLVIAATLFIFSNSVKGPEASGKDSGRVTDTVVGVIESVMGEKIEESEKEDIHYLVRKLAHFLEFAALSLCTLLLVISAYGKTFFKYFPHALLYGLLIAVFDEFIQSFTGRGSAVKDVIIDFSGFVTGYLFFSLVFALIYKIKENKIKGTQAEQE